MSMEQAILEHAGALRELAAAMKEISNVRFVGGDSARGARLNSSMDVMDKVADACTQVADNLEAAKPISVESTPTNVRENKVTTAGLDKAVPAAVEPDAELEAAVSKVEEESKALDYKTDVRPVLLALAKKAGQPALKDLLTKYGAATGDKLTADQFAGIVADANALIAG